MYAYMHGCVFVAYVPIRCYPGKSTDGYTVTHIHTYIHTYMFSYLRTYLLACILTCLHRCMDAKLNQRTHASMHSFVHTPCMPICTCTCTYTQCVYCIYIYMYAPPYNRLHAHIHIHILRTATNCYLHLDIVPHRTPALPSCGKQQKTTSDTEKKQHVLGLYVGSETSVVATTSIGCSSNGHTLQGCRCVELLLRLTWCGSCAGSELRQSRARRREQRYRAALIRIPAQDKAD